MRKRLAQRPWLAAIVSWAVSTALVSVGYGLWLWSQGEPFNWKAVRFAALVAALIAGTNAWRDSRRNKQQQEHQ
jgi:hypothetical protein